MQSKNGCIYVPLRDIGGVVTWQKETQTASLQHSTGSTVTTQVGSKVLTVEQNAAKRQTVMPNAPYIDHNVTYVPLRPVCEALGYTVSWQQEAKCTVLYAQDEQNNSAFNDPDLTTSRNAALAMPRLEIGDTFDPEGELMTHATYYFPYGESGRFIRRFWDVLSYYEIHDGAAWLVWQAKTEDYGSKIIAEHGQRPEFGDKQVYFIDYFQANSIVYGTIENGEEHQQQELQDVNDRIIVYPIDGETRID